MPFKSQKQRRYLYANMPKMAKKWSDEEKKIKEANVKRRTKRGSR